MKVRSLSLQEVNLARERKSISSIDDKLIILEIEGYFRMNIFEHIKINNDIYTRTAKKFC